MRIRTDRSTEYWSEKELHEYELYLTLEDIDHSKTKAKATLTNGIYERLHRTMQKEFYAIAFKKRIYNTLDELQSDLNLYLEEYNTQRMHSGKYCYARTPMQTFIEPYIWQKKKRCNALRPQHNYLIRFSRITKN